MGAKLLQFLIMVNFSQDQAHPLYLIRTHYPEGGLVKQPSRCIQLSSRRKVNITALHSFPPAGVVPQAPSFARGVGNMIASVL